MLVQDHLRLVEHLAQPACLGGGGQLPADAAAGDGRQRQDIEAAEFSAGRQLQVPAIDGGGVKGPAIRELAIEFVDDGLRLRGVNPETAAVGENQSLLVQAQMHRVGAQPAGLGRRWGGVFAEDAESGVGRMLAQAEAVAEGRFERLRRTVAAPAARDQRVQARAGEGVEAFAVVGFGPDEFGNNQGELHRDGRSSAVAAGVDGRAAAALREDGRRQGAVAPGKSVA
jgi:hypothetical protein